MPVGRRTGWILAALVAAGGVVAWLALARARAGARTVVLVTIDTLRRDRVGCYGAATVTTPRIDEVATAGARFADARTPAPLTLPAHATMLTGLPPSVHGVRVNGATRLSDRAGRDFPLLAERLSAAGRRCGAFVSAGPLAGFFGLAHGFEVYDDEGLDDFGGPAYEERPGSETVRRALAWLAGLGRDEPAFLWVHLFEPHEPHPVGGAAGYDVDVASADAVVGLLLDGLRAAGREDAAVCLTSDHGESLGELGEASHGWLLGESVLRVPFLLKGPGVPPGTVRTDPVDLADVAPTLLALAGLEPEPSPGLPGAGVDLLAGTAPPDRVRVAESAYAWQQFRWAQLTCATGRGHKLEDRGEGRERLFRLTDDEPPYQDAGVGAAGRPEAAALADALRRYRRPPTGGGGAATLSGVAPGGYAAGGPVGDLLEPRENGALPDPYEVVSDAYALLRIDALAAAPAAPGREPEALAAQLSPIVRRDPKNPFAAFVRGRIAKRAGRPGEAEKALREALDLGRLEPNTLLLAADAAAAAGPAAGLALLDAYAGRVAPDTRVALLEARLATVAGDPARAREACRKAAQAARNRRDRELVAAEAGCR
jgi:hypothetical protein